MINVTYMDKRLGQKERSPVIRRKWKRGLKISDLARDVDVLCFLNDEPESILKTSDRWDDLLVDGSCLIFVETDQEPISLTIATFAAAASANAAAALGFAAIGQALVGITSVLTAVTAGAWLQSGLQKLMAPSAQSLGVPLGSNTRAGTRDSPTYGFDSPRTTAQNLVPYPIPYGIHDTAGRVLMAYTQANGNFGKDIKVLLALGEGPIHRIGRYDTDQDDLGKGFLPDGMTINGMPANDLDGISCSLRMGTLNQTPVKNFRSGIGTEYAQNFRLSTGSVMVWNTRDFVQRVKVNIFFPLGLNFVDQLTGEKKNATVKFRLDIRNLDGAMADDVNGDPATKEYTITNNRSRPLHYTFASAHLNPDFYQVRIYRTSPNSGEDKKGRTDFMDVDGLVEFQHVQLAYPFMSLAAFTITASEKIQGGLPNFKIPIMGRKVGTPDDPEAWSNMPADVFKDMALHRRYGAGAGIEEEDINAVSSAAFRTWCYEYIARFTGADVADYAIAGTTTANGTTIIVGVGTAFREDIILGECIALSSDPSVRATVVRIQSNVRMEVDIPIGDGTSQALTVNHGLQHRFTFNGIYDTERTAWETLSGIAAIARGVLVRNGSEIKIPFEGPQEQRMPFGAGNIVAKSLQWRGINTDERANVIDAEFEDATNNYQRDFKTAEKENLDQLGEAVRRQSVSLIPGTTDPDQANRMAHYHLRNEQLIRFAMSWDARVDAMHVEVGDSVWVADSLGTSGRLLAPAVGTGFAVLDRPFTFEAGKVYRYSEQDYDDQNAEYDFTTTAGRTTTMPFAPLFGATYNDPMDPDFGATTALGRKYSVGLVKADKLPVLLRTINRSRSHTAFAMEAVEYVEAVYGDDAPANQGGIFTPTLGDAPAPVTNVEVVETSTTAGISHLVITWDASGDATAYEVFLCIGTAVVGALQSYGETEALTFAVDLEGVAMGTPITVCIQSIAPDERRNSLSVSTADSHVALHIIRRVSNGTTIVLFPERVQNLILTAGAGNNSVLSWDAVTTDTNGDAMTVTGYEVRLGEWMGGVVIARQVGTSLALKLPDVTQRINVRAYKTQGGEDWYSPGNRVIESAAIALSAYPTAVASSPYDFDLRAAGLLANFTGLPWDEYLPVIQAVIDLPASYLSQTIDAGASIAVHAGLDLRVTSYLEDDGNDHYASEQHFSLAGQINRNYISYTVILEYSDNASFVPLLQANLATAMNTDLVVTGRYFRVRFSGNATQPFLTDDPPVPERLATILLERIKLSLDKA